MIYKILENYTSKYQNKSLNNKLFVSLILVFCFWSLFSSVSYARAIESISISNVKDTTLLVFEVDTNVKIVTSCTSNASLRLVINARSAIENLKPKGILKKISIKADSSQTAFDLIFERPYDFLRSNETNTVMFKFYPIPVRQIKTILLDPGHGGIDPGAVGRKKLQEKEVNLSIAKTLKKKLEDYGVKVLMTRSDDQFVSLADRSKFANDKKVDLFISVHCNASTTNRKACGFETYYLSEAKTDLERAALARENGALKYEPEIDDDIVRDDLSLILADLTQSEFLKESYNLALAVQTAGINALQDVDRGVKQAGFYVLRVSYMPAILIECGFLTNPTEEKQLSSGRYQEKVAQAIFTGVANYIKDYENRTEF